ncbi:hypothetical protein J6590_039588 [Homalodisca vitripennis]|nr:hypothetical protein J6590_039588 [Homalodisca vitripennis]
MAEGNGRPTVPHLASGSPFTGRPVDASLVTPTCRSQSERISFAKCAVLPLLMCVLQVDYKRTTLYYIEHCPVIYSVLCYGTVMYKLRVW